MTNQRREEDKAKNEGQNLQYEKPTPSLAGSLRSWTTAVPSATLTLSLLRQTVWSLSADMCDTFQSQFLVHVHHNQQEKSLNTH